MLVIGYLLFALIVMLIFTLIVKTTKSGFDYSLILKDHNKNPSSQRFFSLIIVIVFTYASLMIFGNLSAIFGADLATLKVLSFIYLTLGIMAMFPKLVQKIIESYYSKTKKN